MTNEDSLQLLTARQAAKLLGVTTSTLAVWRCTKRYPLRYVKIGGKVRYRQSDLVQFIEVRTVNNEPTQPTISRRRRRVIPTA
jgi:excisionase family DNA binding protein